MVVNWTAQRNEKIDGVCVSATTEFYDRRPNRISKAFFRFSNSRPSVIRIL